MYLGAWGSLVMAHSPEMTVNKDHLTWIRAESQQPGSSCRRTSVSWIKHLELLNMDQNNKHTVVFCYSLWNNENERNLKKSRLFLLSSSTSAPLPQLCQQESATGNMTRITKEAGSWRNSAHQSKQDWSQAARSPPHPHITSLPLHPHLNSSSPPVWPYPAWFWFQAIAHRNDCDRREKNVYSPTERWFKLRQ